MAIGAVRQTERVSDTPQIKDLDLKNIKNILSSNLKPEEKKVVESLLNKLAAKGDSKLEPQERDLLKGLVNSIFSNNSNISSSQRKTLESLSKSLNQDNAVLRQQDKEPLKKIFNGIAQNVLKIGKSIGDGIKSIFSSIANKVNAQSTENNQARTIRSAQDEPVSNFISNLFGRKNNNPSSAGQQNNQVSNQSRPSETSRTGNSAQTQTASKSAIDTSKMSTEEKFSFYSKQAKGKVDLTPGARNIVSLRSADDPTANGGKGTYNDKTAVFWVDQTGKKHVEEFTSNTDPAAVWAGGGGRNAESGRMREGQYTFKVAQRTSNGADCLEPVGGVSVDRFRNGDYQAVGGRNGSMLFHKGGEAGDTQSAGCQTMAPGEWDRFWATMSGGSKQGNIKYTIVETGNIR